MGVFHKAERDLEKYVESNAGRQSENAALAAELKTENERIGIDSARAEKALTAIRAIIA